MQIVPNEDNMHEMSYPVFWVKKYEKYHKFVSGKDWYMTTW